MSRCWRCAALLRLRAADRGPLAADPQTTASLTGIRLGNGIYGVSKHGVVAMTESLFTELRAAGMGGTLSAHVLCPQTVATNITISERNRHLQERGGSDAAVTPDTSAPGHQAFQCAPPSQSAGV